MQPRNRSAHAAPNRSVLYSIEILVTWASWASAYTVRSSFAVEVTSTKERVVISGRSSVGGVSDP
jgi:hypothetical protein